MNKPKPPVDIKVEYGMDFEFTDRELYGAVLEVLERSLDAVLSAPRGTGPKIGGF